MKTFPSSYAVGSKEEAEKQAADAVLMKSLLGQAKSPITMKDLLDLPQYEPSDQPTIAQIAYLNIVASRLGLSKGMDSLFSLQMNVDDN